MPNSIFKLKVHILSKRGRLLNRIQEWAEYMRYQKKPLPVLNQPDINENTFLLKLFPDDQNIGWVYDDSNIHLKLLSTKAIKGVSIDRSKNLEKKYYSMIEEKEQIQYKFTAKHIPEAPPSERFLQHKIEFISNRFLVNEGSPQEGTVRHMLQIETPSGYRWFERMNHYHITDVDNCLDGNPHLII